MCMFWEQFKTQAINVRLTRLDSTRLMLSIWQVRQVELSGWSGRAAAAAAACELLRVWREGTLLACNFATWPD